MFAIEYSPWLTSSELEIGCQLETPDPQNQTNTSMVILEELEKHNIKPEVQVKRKFQSQVGVFLSLKFQNPVN